MVSQHRLESFFPEIKFNGMTSFMEFMISCIVHPRSDDRPNQAIVLSLTLAFAQNVISMSGSKKEAHKSQEDLQMEREDQGRFHGLQSSSVLQ